ncbi:MAG: hypothetical protein HN348_23180 [Proteobacteria bacterium]|jgi:hypothetical protein|nr:hypothetical protein [Pseudomonadota bacterium]
MKIFKTCILATLVGLGGCGGDTQTVKTTTEPTPEQPAELPAPPPFNPTDAENIALVPSPVETEKALVAAGIDTRLSSLIPDRTLDMDVADLDQAALRSGVVLADMLLTVKTAEKEELLAYLSKIRVGMKQLRGGKDIDATLRDMTERIRADSVSRGELLKEFDELSGAVIPELEFNGNDRVVPLIEAGSWVEGANLVSRAVKEKGDSTSADQLLKQPAVVDYFSRYVKKEGDRAPEAITKQLVESLDALHGLAKKTDPLTMEDIDTVILVTDNVLKLL